MSDRRVAGIDCGTNSIRLLIADVDAAGRLHDVVRRMEVVRLGRRRRPHRPAGSEAALERTRVALADYTAQIREHGVEAVRMVATSASRDAANAADFKAMVESVLGRRPEVITGDEEARLSFTGAVAALPSHERPAPARRHRRRLDGVRARHRIRSPRGDLGGHRLRPDDRAAPAFGPAEGRPDRRRGRRHHRQRRQGAAGGRTRPATATELVGLAGTVTTIAAIALGLRRTTRTRSTTRLTYSQVERVTADLAEADTLRAWRSR